MPNEDNTLRFGEDAQNEIQSALEQVDSAIKHSYGPIKLNHSQQSAGLDILKTVKGSTPLQSAVLELIGNELESMQEKTHDGIKLTLLLLNSLFQQSHKFIQDGADPTTICEDMAKLQPELIQEIKKQAFFPTKREEIQKLALIYADHNEHIGDEIADALDFAGPAGNVFVGDSQDTGTHFEPTPGMILNRGYLSPYFCTDLENQIVEYDNPFFFITDQEITSAQHFVPIIQYISTIKRPLVIVAGDISGEALSTTIMNQAQGIIQVCAIKAPGSGARRKELLEDLAIFTGAELISKEMEYDLTHVGPEALGASKKILVKKDCSIILNGLGNPKLITMRSKSLLQRAHSETISSEIRELKQRSNNFSRGIGVISVGSEDLKQQQEKKAHFEKCLALASSSLKDGACVGGGAALFHLSEKLSQENTGMKIMRQALRVPLAALVQNHGLDAKTIMSEASSSTTLGFNADTEAVEDLTEAGISDPLNILTSAIRQSISLCNTLLQTDALIAITKQVTKHSKEEKE